MGDRLVIPDGIFFLNAYGLRHSEVNKFMPCRYILRRKK